MRRDHRLHGLSSDHHHALVLARRLSRACDAGVADVALAKETRRIHEEELEPHFRVEEELMLPALAAAGAGDLVDRTLREHEALRAHLSSAEAGDLPSALSAFASLLTAHVRFEEGELFPAAERILSTDVLDALAAAAPHAHRHRGQ